MKLPTAARRALATLALSLLAALPAGAANLTPQEEDGKKVFLEGVSPSGAPMQALVGPYATPVDASALPCGSCHGVDGLGRPEGAVKPTGVRWQELAKSYGHRHENGRTHPAYDEKNFAASITDGKDPAGNVMDTAMPRYVMSNKDMDALVAYLKKLEFDLDPGIFDDRLRIGTLMPKEGRLAELGQAVLGLMKAQVEDINGKGGIFGRKLDLVVADFPDDRAGALASAEKLFRNENVFAVVSPFTAGIEKDLSQLAESAKVPVVGPLTLFPAAAVDVINRNTFYLLPGLEEQGRVLAEFATQGLNLTNPVVAVVHPQDDDLQKVAEAAMAQMKERKWSRVDAASYPPGRMPAHELVARMQQRGVQVILFLGTDAELAELGPHIRDAIWTPYLLAPGARVGRAATGLPNTLGSRIFLSYPTLPADITDKGAATLTGLQKKHKLSNRHQPSQVSAYVSMLVLEEGLKRAGRDMSRAKLIGSLENLFSFETALTPAITYGPSRRIGAMGGYVVAVDPVGRKFKPVGKYIRLE